MGERAKRACWACGKELEEGDYCPECLEKREKELDQLLEPILREKRRYARYDVSLPMAFQRPREPKARRAEVLDISKGGLRFSSPEELDEGELVNVLVRSSDRSVDVRAVVRVVRATPAQSGWVIAAEFVARGQSLRMRDRRRHARMETELRMTYFRAGEREERHGVLQDVSQGGVKFLTREALEVDETIRAFIGEAEGVKMIVEAVEETPEGRSVRAVFAEPPEEGTQWKGV